MRSEPRLSIEICKKFGPTKLCILEYFIYRMFYNRKHKRNEHMGMFWVYETYNDLSDKLCIACRTLIRKIKELEDEDVLLSGSFNKYNRDNTKWYTIIDEWVLGEFGYQEQRVIDLIKDIPGVPITKTAGGIMIDYSVLPPEYQAVCSYCLVPPPVFDWASDNPKIKKDFFYKLDLYNQIMLSKDPDDKEFLEELSEQIYDFTIRFHKLLKQNKYRKRCK